MSKIITRELYSRNPETGEIETESMVHVKHVKVEEFIQVYVKDIAALVSPSMGAGNKWRVMIVLWQRANRETNEVYLLLDDKEQIKEQLGLTSVNYLNKLISELKRDRMILRLSNGKYMLNPATFFKGNSIQRQKVLTRSQKYVLE